MSWLTNRPRPGVSVPASAIAWIACVPLLYGASGPLDPNAARATFELEPGLTIDLVAAEPLVRSPAAMAWDASARLHVVENPDYPVGPAAGQPPGGALVQLTDTDGDGRMDQRTVLADGLRFPNGLHPWRGGWLVTDAPDLLWLADTNHDGRADLREVWFTGFATNQTTQLRANSPTLGPDGWLYVARGLVGGTVTSPKWPALKPVDLKAGDFRFRPDGSAAEAIGGNAQFGLVLDDVGRRFLVSNRNPLMHAVLDPRWWARHPWLPFTEVVQDVSPTGYDAKVFPRSADTTTAGFMPELLTAPHAGTFTAACGIHQHFGGGLGPEREGSWLICEPAQNLVQRQVATPRGVTFTSRRATDNGEFLTSTDPWFHPVFAATGPDASVYLADFYRGLIDHPEYLPAEIRPRLDFNAGRERGRIWRVHAVDRSAKRTPEPPGPEAATWMDALSHSNLWTRQTAHRLLYERGDAAALRAILGNLSDLSTNQAVASDAALAAGTARRLRLLVGMLPLSPLRSQLGPADHAAITNALCHALLSPAPAVREATLRALADPGISRVAAAPLNLVRVEWLGRLLFDPDPKVRFHALQARLAYRGIADGGDVCEAYALVALRSDDDRWSRALALVGLLGRELETLRDLVGVGTSPIPSRLRAHELLVADLARVLGVHPEAADREFLDFVLALPEKGSSSPLANAALQGYAEGLRARGAGPLASLMDRLIASGQLPPGASNRFLAVAENARRRAQDPAAAPEARLPAIRFLAELPAASVVETLVELVQGTHPAEVRLAAVRALGLLGAPGSVARLTAPSCWPSLTPALQQEALANLATRASLLPELLDALEAGRLPAWIINASQRRALMDHRDEALRQRARRLLGHPGGAARHQAYEALKPLAARAGNAAAGRVVFERTCASCHRLGHLGIEVGPDLTSVRNQPPEALLLHLVIPDAEIYPGYQAYEIETHDGRTFTGLVVAETVHAVTVRMAGGGQETLNRAQIASLTLSRVSLMPQELEKTMTGTELTDLLAFLRAAP